MTPKISLVKYNWVSDGIISVTGYTWLGGEYVSGEAFLKLLAQNSGSFGDMAKLAGRLNGQFSFTIKKQSEVWAACSHTWSYPLFYHHSKNEIFVSDDPEVLIKELPSPGIDTFSKKYFLLFGVTPQNNTLIQQVCQIMPREILRIKASGAEGALFFNPVGRTPSLEVGGEKFHQCVRALFERYFNYLKNKHVLLPLTSGYDSRMLACLLKEFGHKNVLCATWGRKGNAELAIAKKTANQLGYPHVSVEYNTGLVSGFIKEGQFFDYVKYAGHCSSMPFLQDYFAIDYLKKKQLVTESTVVMPGHSGFFAGSHLDAKMGTAGNSYPLSKIINKYSSSYPLKPKDRKEVERHILDHFFAGNDTCPWQKFEKWDFQDRQCKFISNSNHAWFFVGLEVLMPLFDKDFVNFFKQVPFGQKHGKIFYNTTQENKIFIPHKVNFSIRDKVQKPQGNFDFLKNLVLKSSPAFVKNFYYQMDDDIYYREITRELRNATGTSHYKKPVRPNSYNCYIIQWYLHYLCTMRK